MTSLRLLPFALAVAVATLLSAVAPAQAAAPVTRPAAASADNPGSITGTPAPDQAALDRRFAELLTNASLKGSYTMGQSDQPKKDSYTILRAEKAEGELWAITAKVEYKGFAVPVEMKVPVKWAGDTPVISITDQKIPMLGTFTARVMFYGDQYAGTWSGGNHGGLMWGRVEKLAATRPAAAP